MTALPTIAVIGSGNMGSSLLGGLIRNHHPSDKLWATDQDEAKLAQLQKDFHINISIDNRAAVKAADIVILAIKPQFMAEVLEGLAETVQHKKPLILSIAAGIREKSLATWLGGDLAIIRAMPNTPALIGYGATVLFANTLVDARAKEIAASIMSSLGLVLWVEDEKLMDVVTALSGSGPAYFYLMMEALQEAAIEMGLTEEVAHQLTVQTAYGATRMALDSPYSLTELRRQVTSPGGTTEKAIQVLEENNIRGLFRKALQAAKMHSEVIADKMGK